MVIRRFQIRFHGMQHCAQPEVGAKISGNPEVLKDIDNLLPGNGLVPAAAVLLI